MQHAITETLHLAVLDKRILNFSFRLPWQPEFCMGFNSFNNFKREPPKEHSFEVWCKFAQWF